MQVRGESEELDEAQKLFNQLLKRSRHFADVVNTQRLAIGEILAALVITVTMQNPDLAVVMRAALTSLQRPSGRPSVDAERQLLTRLALASMESKEDAEAGRG